MNDKFISMLTAKHFKDISMLLLVCINILSMLILVGLWFMIYIGINSILMSIVLLMNRKLLSFNIYEYLVIILGGYLWNIFIIFQLIKSIINEKRNGEYTNYELNEDIEEGDE